MIVPAVGLLITIAILSFRIYLLEKQSELDRTRVSALSTQIIDLEIALTVEKVLRISR